MTMQAEIDAIVGAFVEDLVELVRRTALSAVQSALTGHDGGRPPMPRGEAARPTLPAKPPKARKVANVASVARAANVARAKSASSAKSSAKSAPTKRPAPVAPEEPEEVEVATPAPAPIRKRLDRQRRGRLIVMPSSESAKPPVELEQQEAVEAPRPRAVKSDVPPPEAAAAEPTPAKKWVIVRRPARDRAASASEPPPNGQRASEPPPQDVTNGVAPQDAG